MKVATNTQTWRLAIKKAQGFSVIELLVSIAVLAILTTLALPSMKSIYDNNQAKSAAKLFQDNLRQARYESRAYTGSSIVFCAVRSDDNTVCQTGSSTTSLENGWQWFVDLDSDNIYDKTGVTPDILLGMSDEVKTNKIKVSLDAALTDNLITFVNGVSSNQTSVISFPNNSNTSVQHTVSFDATGRTILAYH